MASVSDTRPGVEEAQAGPSCTNTSEVLRFENVSVQFDERTALDNVSFEMKAGETIVLSGAAGSGKTVLLKTAIGLIQPTAGDVYLAGQNITARQEGELFSLRRCVGVLFQEGALFDSLTIAENVAFPLLNPPDRKLPDPEVQSRVHEALKFVGLESEEEKLPSDLSGGMRRRCGIARAIVTKPPLILYDSPTAGLDPITAYLIMALVIRQRDIRNTASIVVTYRHQDGRLVAHYRHDPNTGKPTRARDALPPTRFLVLREGHLVFQGSLAEMLASTDPYVARFAGRRITASK